jgi:serine kinase of HPr protein (carbohydrate metabolism regulator)
MKVRDLLQNNNFELLNSKGNLDNEIDGIFAGDLLSHVMGFASESNLFITVLNNINVLGVASLLDFSCVIFAHNIEVNETIINKADELELPVIKTSTAIAETVITLHKMGVK